MGVLMIELKINGQPHSIDADPDMPLLWALRELVGLTGTKFGCGMAQCGACTVHIDGVPTRSCITVVSDAVGTDIVTIEGVSGKVAEAVQTTWVKMDVPQCGYCQSGQVMAAVALLTEKKKPSDAEIDDAMSGNLCRCATYHRIRGAIHEAAKLLEA
jgi:isoquinoline 1-oxidoreductase subunit alpha